METHLKNPELATKTHIHLEGACQCPTLKGEKFPCSECGQVKNSKDQLCYTKSGIGNLIHFST